MVDMLNGHKYAYSMVIAYHEKMSLCSYNFLFLQNAQRIKSDWGKKIFGPGYKILKRFYFACFLKIHLKFSELSIC